MTSFRDDIDSDSEIEKSTLAEIYIPVSVVVSYEHGLETINGLQADPQLECMTKRALMSERNGVTAIPISMQVNSKGILLLDGNDEKTVFEAFWVLASQEQGPKYIHIDFDLHCLRNQDNATVVSSRMEDRSTNSDGILTVIETLFGRFQSGSNTQFNITIGGCSGTEVAYQLQDKMSGRFSHFAFSIEAFDYDVFINSKNGKRTLEVADNLNLPGYNRPTQGRRDCEVEINDVEAGKLIFCKSSLVERWVVLTNQQLDTLKRECLGLLETVKFNCSDEIKDKILRDFSTTSNIEAALDNALYYMELSEDHAKDIPKELLEIGQKIKLMYETAIDPRDYRECRQRVEARASIARPALVELYRLSEGYQHRIEHNQHYKGIGFFRQGIPATEKRDACINAERALTKVVYNGASSKNLQELSAIIQSRAFINGTELPRLAKDVIEPTIEKMRRGQQPQSPHHSLGH